jgi:hypothetical protein
MGCDIHVYCEKKNKDGIYEYIDENFINYRNYGIFGFLAGVRNYSAINPISTPRYIPKDASNEVLKAYKNWDCDAHSASWLSVKELLDFNYEDICEDRRCMINNNGGCTCKEGEGKFMTYREFLGNDFIEGLGKLKELKIDRIIFWFDN